MNNMRKLTLDDIKIEDMFVGDKVVSRTELCEKLGVKVDKLRSLGGYTKILERFGLTPPSPYYYENKEKIEKFKQFAKEYMKKYSRLPLVKECEENGIFSKEFTKNYGGYKKLVADCGFEHKKTNSYSITFLISKEQMINDFVAYYNTETAPSCVEVDLKYFNGEFYFGKSAIDDRFGTYTEFIKLCGYKSFKVKGYSVRHIAKDGHVCDSAMEKIIDDFLYDNGIEHTMHCKYNKLIKDLDRHYQLDWLLSDGTVVEYFGLVREKSYSTKTLKKLKILEDNDIKYIAIYPDDLGRLDILFCDYLERKAM